jgi:hypothetical protein
MEQFVYLVEKGWSEEFVLNLPHHTRKAIVGISFKQNGVKDFDIEQFIDRRSYFLDEQSLLKYMEKEQKLKQKQLKKAEKDAKKPVQNIPTKIRLKDELKITGEGLSVQDRIALIKKELEKGM